MKSARVGCSVALLRRMNPLAFLLLVEFLWFCSRWFPDKSANCNAGSVRYTRVAAMRTYLVVWTNLETWSECWRIFAWCWKRNVRTIVVPFANVSDTASAIFVKRLTSRSKWFRRSCPRQPNEIFTGYLFVSFSDQGFSRNGVWTFCLPLRGRRECVWQPYDQQVNTRLPATQIISKLTQLKQNGIK